MFDYLLSNGIPCTVRRLICAGECFLIPDIVPVSSHTTSWNIYHLLCVRNFGGTSKAHLTLLKHVLQKLPRDVTAGMLLQQSKDALNTVSAALINPT